MCKKRRIVQGETSQTNSERMVNSMSDKAMNVYDDGNIPDVDLPGGEDSVEKDSVKNFEKRSESSRNKGKNVGAKER